MDANTLKIAEHFYSVQGEGMSIGASAVFLRLAMCNFNCKWCDTVDVWKRGDTKTLDEVDGIFDVSSYYRRMRQGAHLIITGGDPMIQQDALAALFERLFQFGREPSRLYVEVETQGYILPKMHFSKWVRQWNVSPKLANSGIPYEKRIQSDVLRWHGAANSCFKFPISDEREFREVEEIVKKHNLKRTRVYLMPVCSTRKEHEERAPMVADMAKKTGYRFSPRLQLVLWDKATGV